MIKIASVATTANHAHLYGQLALKAQGQCRATLSTLADIKHPKRATFIKQQNNAINQQVNNNNPSEISQKISPLKNELLKDERHETMDTRGTLATIRINPHLETVDTLNRS